MESWGPSREVEKPKRTKAELRTMFIIEARSHANTLDELAAAHRMIHRHNDTIPLAMEKAAKFIRELTK
jgi:hypothetical protein